MFALRQIMSASLMAGMLFAAPAISPQSASSAVRSLPQYVSFTGELKNQEGKPAGGTVDATFLLYEKESGGEPLWTENQRVTLDAEGHFTVTLGANSGGVPMQFFATTKAKWLEIEPEGLPMPNRVLLLSVPYAYKAGDAETLGGVPAGRFVTQEQLAAMARTVAIQSAQGVLPGVSPSGTGTANYLPLWTDPSTLGNSALYQAGSSVGIGTTTPASTLHVYSGDLTIGSQALNFPTKAQGTASINQVSSVSLLRQTLLDGSGRFNMFWNAYNDKAGNKYYVSGEPATKWNIGGGGGAGGSGVYVAPAGTAGGPITWNTVFVANASGDTTLANKAMTLTAGGNVGIGTVTAPAARLEVNGTGKFDGLVTFAAAQTFPGTGTITGVTAGLGLTGGGATGSVTLAVDPTKVPLLNAANTFNGSETVNGDLSATGTVSGLTINAGGANFTGPVTFASSQTFPGLDGRYAQLEANNLFTGVEVIAGGGLGIDIAPSYPLHVNGIMRAETGLSLGGAAQLSVDANGIIAGHFLVDGNGNVGINKPVPTSALDVVGNVNATGSLTAASLTTTTVATQTAATQALTINGDTTMRAAPHMFITGNLPGPLFADQPAAFFIPDKNILITRFSMSVSVPELCGPPGTVSIFNADTGFHYKDLTISGFYNDTGALAIPIPAGTRVLVYVTAGPNCGIQPPTHDGAVSVQYVMQ